MRTWRVFAQTVTYNKEVLERIAPLWDENMSAVEKWNVLCDGLVDVRSELLGRDC